MDFWRRLSAPSMSPRFSWMTPIDRSVNVSALVSLVMTPSRSPVETFRETVSRSVEEAFRQFGCELAG